MFQQNTAAELEIIDEYIKEATRETPNPTVSNNVPITKPCIKKETVCCSLPSSSNRVPVLDGCMNEETRPKKDRHKLSNATGGSPILVPRGSKPEPCFQPKFSLPQSSPITPVMCSYKEPVPEMSSVIFGSATSTTVSGSLLPRSTEPPFCSSWIPQETPHDSRLHYGEKSNNVLEDFLQRPSPKLHITEQPKQRGMRFRYKCEGRSAGSILGANSTEQNKTLPTIELSDCEGIPEVNVVTCVVWKDWPHRIHPHSLVGKDCHDGICEVTLKPKNNKKHSYNNLGIQCVTKRDIETSVEKKINKGFDPFKAGLWKNQEEVDMNVVRLCFQASYQDANGDVHDLEPVLSDPIYDKKSTNTSELKICRINRETGHCVGGEEVYMLCDKVQKEDIAVVFHREAWEAKADFSQADVHRQIAIVFKTPSYQDLEISEPVVVEVCLERVTDKVRSDPFYFTYLPKDHDAYGVDLKRKQGFPDVIGGLSSSDPHGIEAKRRKKKPTYKEHCFQSLEPVPPTPFILPVDSREYQEVSSSFPDNMNQEQMENTVGDFSSFPDNMNYNLPDHNWTSNCEIFLDPFQSFFEDYDPSQNLDPGIELASENTASLIANSMFPNQYKMEEFPQCLEFQGRKDPT